MLFGQTNHSSFVCRLVKIHFVDTSTFGKEIFEEEL